MNIIPKPKSAKEKDGYLCIKPAYITDNPEFLSVLHSFSQLSDRLWGLDVNPLALPMVDNALMTPLTEGNSTEEAEKKPYDVSLEGEERCEGGIYIKTDKSLGRDEYTLDAASSLVITVSGVSGLANALATLTQISSRTCDKYIKVRKCSIKDKPDSDFRAMLLDVARRWHPLEYLYKYTELCSLLKINRFIIHFTDDESYTLPCDAFPLLPTENRHYTKNEIKALCDYASSLGVMIIPEIDMPGHCAQFITKYPDIFGTYGILEASEETFDALEVIYREAAELFSGSDYIHIGGDEAVLGRWSDSEKTKQYMNDNGIEDIVEMYGHYIARISSFILSLGKTPIVWEGFHKSSNHLISRDVLVIAWESHYQLAPDLLEAGFTVINASWKPLYVVSPWRKWSQSEILTWNKYTWDHWWEGSVAYNNPIKVPHDSDVTGAMLCAWGDYMKGYESSRLACQLELACVRTRLPALSERVWNVEDTVDEKAFEEAYRNVFGILKTIWDEDSFRGEI